MNIIRLSKVIEDRGLSLAGFGIKCGVDKSTISRIINGVSKPRTNTINKIKKKLTVQEQIFIFGSDVSA